MMLRKLATIVLSPLLAATVLLGWPASNVLAQTAGATKPNVVTKSMGHPEKQTTAVAVHTTKAKPAPKEEKVPKATRANVSWVPGDYYWDGNNWLWDSGYWIDQPWMEAVWIPGHWNDRWWGSTWVPGYWF